MLTIKQLRDDREAAIRRLAKKGVDAAPVIAEIEKLDDRRKAIQHELDECLATQNQAAKQIGALMGQGRRDEAEAKKAEVASLKERSNALNAEFKEVSDALQAAIVTLPNFPADIVPEGKTAEDNLVVKLVESYTQLPENPLPHWELAKKYDSSDVDLGVKLTGAGFPVYKGKGARLQRALINYFLDCNTKAGYLEVEPPVMVNEASGFGTGQLPDKEGQMYHATADNIYLVPTAEVPVTNIYRDVHLDERAFPVKMPAYTPCFRRAAGSARAEERGKVRGHQFNKVEMFQFTRPEDSDDAFDELGAKAENLVKGLGFHFRTVKLAAGDCSASMARTYDIEIQIPSMNGYKEVSSVSNARDYQARRGNIRFRREATGKPEFVHTLNGSGLATSRIFPAMVEQNQRADGSVVVPEVLRKYLGGLEVLEKKNF